MNKRLLGALLAFASVLCCAPASAATCFAISTAVAITPSNTAMWSSSSGGTGNTCAGGAGAPGVPSTAADVATFDANSGNYTLNWGGTWTVGNIQMSGGSIDNSVNNNNITTGAVNFGSVATIRSINCGTATITLNGTSGILLTAGGSNFTVACGNATWVTTGSTNNTVTIGTLTGGPWGGLVLGPTSGQSGATSISLNGITLRSLDIQVPQRIVWQSGTGPTITNAINWNAGGAAGQILMDVSSGSPTTITLTNGGTGKLISMRSITMAGAGINCTNCATSNVSGVAQFFTSGTACIIGGWLLWRDMPEGINDNFPAWIDRVA